ncbi:MAG TPA: DUF4349 domain-containing protein [Pyrinomonadaceae bacterium]|jgi:hypothetical protein|nr:DUF4349 domain-containing protein [Pyrinomonadaceae bacterium]
MRLFIAVTCLTFLLGIAACTRSGNQGDDASAGSTARTVPNGSQTASNEAAGLTKTASAPNQAAEMQTVSLTQASQSQASQQVAVERKIIRDADINLEVAAPAEGQRRLGTIAEAHGGFVVTSESRMQDDHSRDSQLVEIATVQLRVPASHFDAVLEEIRAIGTRVRSVKQTGKDVTEEFIDLDARLRTQRALEAQFLEIMKSAGEVSDALEVQTQLAAVRTEIERVEGRRRFLENQAALSTINVTLQPPASLVSVNTSGFFAGIKSAFGDGIDIAAAITLGIISFVIALVPVLLLIVLPLALIWHYLLRPRLRRRPKTAAPAPSVADTAT